MIKISSESQASRGKWVSSLLILALGYALTFLLGQSSWSDNLNHLAYDRILAASSPPVEEKEDVVVIGIDDESLQLFPEPLVLWHKYLAQTISGVASLGAKATVLDIIPSISLDTIAPELDVDLKKLDRDLTKAIRFSASQGTPLFMGFMAGEKGLMPHRKFSALASGLGLLNLFSDADGKIRSQTARLMSNRGEQYQSVSVMAAEAVSGNKVEMEKFFIDFRMKLPAVIPLQRIYFALQKGDTAELEAQIKNKIVLIGAVSFKLPDIHTIPFNSDLKRESEIPGILIHALAIKTLLARHYLKEVAGYKVRLLEGGLAMVSGALFLSCSPWLAALAVLALLFCGGFICFFAFDGFSLVFPISVFVWGTLVPGAVAGTYKNVTEYFQFSRLQRHFKSYVSPEVLKEIIDNPESISFSGSQVRATIMFTDIRNFTTLSERLPAQVVVAGLNKYLTEMTRAVIETNGYVNKYLGDGILAVFGAPKKLAGDGAEAAVRCGFSMLEKLERLNVEGIFPGIARLEIGIGIHTGDVIIGNIGSHEKMEYTVIGDAVNLASRIESKTKEYQAPILASEATLELVKDRVEYGFVESTQVKGREEAVKLYKIMSFKKGGGK